MKIVSTRARKKLSGDIDNLAELLKCSSHVGYFFQTYVKVNHPKMGAMNFKMHPYMEDYFCTLNFNPNVIAMICRNAGLTTMSTAFYLWLAMFNPDKTFVLVGNNEFVRDTHNRINFMIAHMPEFLRPKITRYNRNGFEFQNGARIKLGAVSSNVFRGMALDGVYVDNFACNKPELQVDLWASLIPSMYTGANITIGGSVPNAPNDHFAHLWRSASTGMSTFVPFVATVDMCPQYDDSFKTMMQKALGTSAYKREYECEFV